MKIEQKKLPKSQIEIEFELTAEEFAEHFEHTLEHLKSHVKIDGFRQGKVPAKLAEEKIKPEILLMEAGDHAVQHVYSDYIKQSGLEPVGHPEVSIIKIAKGNPFIFKAKITVLPEVELPDYKAIAKTVKLKDVSVTDEEVEDSIKYLQKSRAKFTLKNDVAEKGDFVEIEYENKDVNAGKPVNDRFILGEAGFVKGFEENIIGMKAGEEKIFDLPEKGNFALKVKLVQKVELSEITDEFAKQLGGFDTLVALKNSIKEGITAEKTEAEKQRKRTEILEKISEKVSARGGSALGGEMPEAVVEYEKQNMLADLKNKIGQGLKISFEQYLATIKKTEKEVLDTYQKEAEKRIKNFLTLKEIGKKENVKVSDAEIEEEVKKIPKGEFDINQFKEYTKGVLYNEKVFKILENN